MVVWYADCRQARTIKKDAAQRAKSVQAFRENVSVGYRAQGCQLQKKIELN